MNNGNEMDRLSMRLSRFGDFSLEQLKSLNMNVRHQFSNLRDFNNIRKWSPVNCHQQSYNLCTPFKYDIRCTSLSRSANRAIPWPEGSHQHWNQQDVKYTIVAESIRSKTEWNRSFCRTIFASKSQRSFDWQYTILRFWKYTIIKLKVLNWKYSIV